MCVMSTTSMLGDDEHIAQAGNVSLWPISRILITYLSQKAILAGGGGGGWGVGGGDFMSSF